MQEAEEGIIAYDDCGVKLTISYQAKDVEGSASPQIGDKVITTRDIFLQFTLLITTVCSYFGKNEKQYLTKSNVLFRKVHVNCSLIVSTI